MSPAADRSKSDVSETIQEFLAQAGDVAKQTYEQFWSYADDVKQPMAELRDKAADVARNAPDKDSLDAAATAFAEAGAIFFQLANRALEANADAARGENGLASESVQFFRNLGMLWLDSTVGQGPAVPTPTADRIREVTFQPVKPGSTAEQSVSIVSRAVGTTTGDIVWGALMGPKNVSIPAGRVTVRDKSRNNIRPPVGVRLTPGRTQLTVSVAVPPRTAPGQYRGLLSVSAAGIESSIVLTVIVARARTPARTRTPKT
jgi:hypothetical protein